MSKTLPVLLIGKTTQIGRVVTTALKPEYDVIHFIQSAAQAETAIPAILDFKTDSLDTSADELGSKDFSSRPVAVIVGGVLDDADVNALRKTVLEKTNGKAGLPWIIRGEGWEQRIGPLGPGYGEAAANSVKQVLPGIVSKRETEKDGLYYW